MKNKFIFMLRVFQILQKYLSELFTKKSRGYPPATPNSLPSEKLKLTKLVEDALRNWGLLEAALKYEGKRSIT